VVFLTFKSGAKKWSIMILYYIGDIHELVSSYNILFSFYTGTGAFEENVLSEDLSQ